MRSARRRSLALLLPLAALLCAVAADASVPRAAGVWESNPPAAMSSSARRVALEIGAAAPENEASSFHIFSELALEEDLGDPSLRLGFVLPAHELELEPHHLDELLSASPLRGPPLSYPETRVWAFDFAARSLVSAERPLSLELRWACGASGCEVVAGQRKDPLGLCVGGLPCPGWAQNVGKSLKESYDVAYKPLVEQGKRIVNSQVRLWDMWWDTTTNGSKYSAEERREIGNDAALGVLEAAAIVEGFRGGTGGSLVPKRASKLDPVASGIDDYAREVERQSARSTPPLSASSEGASPAPYSTRRPNLRRGTEKSAWDKAADGSVPNSKACPDCNVDVFGNPYTGELRNTPFGWDVEHVRKWELIRRELQVRKANPAEYRDAYNDLNNTILRCRSCNRADNQVPRAAIGGE